MTQEPFRLPPIVAAPQRMVPVRMPAPQVAPRVALPGGAQGLPVHAAIPGPYAQPVPWGALGAGGAGAPDGFSSVADLRWDAFGPPVDPKVHLSLLERIANAVERGAGVAFDRTRGRIGGTRDITPIAEQQTFELVRIQPDPLNPTPEAISIALDIADIGQGLLDVPNAIGQVRYGSGDRQTATLFDWVRGTVLNVFASAVYLDVIIAASAAVPPPAPVRVSAWAGRGTRPSAHPVVFTQYAPAAIGPDGLEATLQIPAQATGVWPIRSPTQSTDLEFVLRDADGTIVHDFYWPAMDQPEAFIPIPRFATEVVLRNESPPGGSTMIAAAIFQLAL